MATGLGVPRTQPRWQEQAGQYLGQAGNSYARMDKAQYRPEYEKSAGGALQSAVSMGMAGMEAGGLIGGSMAASASGGAGLGITAGMGGAGELGVTSIMQGSASGGLWGLGIGAALGLGMYLFS
jgi:hypothetical protein